MSGVHVQATFKVSEGFGEGIVLGRGARWRYFVDQAKALLVQSRGSTLAPGNDEKREGSCGHYRSTACGLGFIMPFGKCVPMEDVFWWQV